MVHVRQARQRTGCARALGCRRQQHHGGVPVEGQQVVLALAGKRHPHDAEAARRAGARRAGGAPVGARLLGGAVDGCRCPGSCGQLRGGRNGHQMRRHASRAAARLVPVQLAPEALCGAEEPFDVAVRRALQPLAVRILPDGMQDGADRVLHLRSRQRLDLRLAEGGAAAAAAAGLAIRQRTRIGECAVEPVARRQRRAIGCAVGSMVALRVRHRIGRHHHPLHLKQSGEFLPALRLGAREAAASRCGSYGRAVLVLGQMARLHQDGRAIRLDVLHQGIQDLRAQPLLRLQPPCKDAGEAAHLGEAQHHAVARHVPDVHAAVEGQQRGLARGGEVDVAHHHNTAGLFGHQRLVEERALQHTCGVVGVSARHVEQRLSHPLGRVSQALPVRILPHARQKRADRCLNSLHLGTLASDQRALGRELHRSS
mmetsp:Transcript_17018/g.43617  ORF Transcript_17018/g.43617 Transcript_17018/m.43617 type:complete len:427 (+) Transcript_17018:565-1845(+)